MAEKGGLQLVGGDAAPVVRYPEEGHAPVGDLHRDGRGPGVHRIFDQLFGGAGGPLHHLAGGDQIGHVGI